MISLTKWNELPKGYKAIVEAASAYAQTWMLSKYDAENPKALRELAAGGTKLMPFPQPRDGGGFAASNELYAELSAKNPKFKKIYDHWRPFRNEEILWFRVCEGSFDNFMARSRRPASSETSCEKPRFGGAFCLPSHGAAWQVYSAR